MAVFSKFILLPDTCQEYVHPWTKSCTDASAGLGFTTFQESFRIYVTVYVLAMLMRGKPPSQKDIKGTLLRIFQSTSFLTCHAFSYSLFLCLLRRLLGHFNFLTVSFLPSFLASYFSILVERPSRRGLLCLYVTNVASETLFRMAVWRGWVKPVRYGEVIVFTTAIAGLLYFYRGNHISHDSIYGLLRFVVGPFEESGYMENREDLPPQQVPAPVTARRTPRALLRSVIVYRITSTLCRAYRTIVKWVQCYNRHSTCPHPFSCFYYTLQGAVKLFSVGYGLQVCLRLLLQARRLLRQPSVLFRVLTHRDAFMFGAFLGGFSGIFRMTSCIMRWIFDKDSKFHAIPAGIFAGLTFGFFPDNTIALYVMWKVVQLLQMVLSLLPRVEVCGSVRLTCRRLAEAAATLLADDVSRLRRRYKALAHLLAEHRQQQQATPATKAAAARAELAFSAIHDQLRQLHAATWRYFPGVRGYDCGPLMCVYAGRLVDAFWKYARDAAAKPPQLGASFFRGSPSPMSRLAAACNKFIDHFERYTEAVFNSHWSDAGAKVFDLLDCMQPSGCTQFSVLDDTGGQLLIKAKYRLCRAWFTCLPVPDDGREEPSWRLEQRFMFMRIRRLVARSNTLRLQEQRYIRELEIRGRKPPDSAAMVPRSIYCGFGHHRDKFFYYGTMNDTETAELNKKLSYVDVDLLLQCPPHLAPFRIYHQLVVPDTTAATHRRHLFRLEMTVSCPAAEQNRLPAFFKWQVVPKRRRRRRKQQNRSDSFNLVTL